MFKGESELDVFDNSAALKELVDKFSDIRKFDVLVDNTAKFEEKSNAAYTKEMKSDARVSREANELDSKIKRVSEEISTLKGDIKEKQTSYDVFSNRLTQLEQNQETSQRYRDIQNRLKTQEEKAIRLKAQIGSVDYNQIGRAHV